MQRITKSKKEKKVIRGNAGVFKDEKKRREKKFFFHDN